MLLEIVKYIKSPIGWLAGAVTLLLSAWGWLAWHDRKVVNKERSRVEQLGNKLNAKARSAADRARANPSGVLERFYRD